MTIIALVAVAAYIFVSLAVVIPNKALPAPLVSVSNDARPFFNQSWQVFAPNILKSNVKVEAMAQWRNDSGELVKSPWIPVTAVEQRSVSGSIIPSRINKSSWNAAQTYASRFNKLNAEQKKVVQNSFIKNVDDGSTRPLTRKEAAALIAKHGDNLTAINNVLNYDDLFIDYMGLYTTAYFGKKVERVRWKIVYTRPNDFVHRFEDAQQFKDKELEFGWRQFDRGVTKEELTVYREVLQRYGAIK